MIKWLFNGPGKNKSNSWTEIDAEILEDEYRVYELGQLLRKTPGGELRGVWDEWVALNPRAANRQSAWDAVEWEMKWRIYEASVNKPEEKA